MILIKLYFMELVEILHFCHRKKSMVSSVQKIQKQWGFFQDSFKHCDITRV